MRWTREQDSILRELASFGAEACRDAIYSRTGAMRSVGATERHANRIGVSLVRFETCPRCARKVARLKSSSNLCSACHEIFLAERVREERDALLREIRSDGNDESYEKGRRAYASARQQKSRVARRRGDFVDLSVDLSVARPTCGNG